MRAFAPKTELLTAGGGHLRYIPAELAWAMVAAGIAVAHNSNGKVKSIKLLMTASSNARVIGPSGEGRATPPFCVRERLDGGYVVWRHHKRATDYE